MHSVFSKVLRGEKTQRPPVWFMRQAGRCLPEYRALKEKHSFFELMSNPQLASEVTLMPVKTLGVDAAIVFSDILILIEALGIKIDYENGKPRICTPIGPNNDNPDKIVNWPNQQNLDVFARTYQTLAMVKKKSDVPLIGFCGGPLTIFFYLFEGKHDNFHRAKQFLYTHREQAREILRQITDCSITYALGQIQEKIDAFQIFESWAGEIPNALYQEIVLPQVLRLCDAIKKHVPVIFYPRGYGQGYDDLPQNMANVLGVDHFATMESIKKKVGDQQILQGNLDPYVPLATSEKDLIATVDEKLQFFHQHPQWIVNLGHGVLPETPWQKLKIIVDRIKDFS